MKRIVSSTKTLQTMPRIEKVVTPDEFLKLYERGAVTKAQVIPARLGYKGFGKIRVRLSKPIYEVKA